jgi:PadR family transcriptional regulator PadR
VDDFLDNWTVQARKGLLELCILTAVSDEERYGYELVKTLIAIPGLGVTEGTVYPLLSRLKLAGLIASRIEESATGPARKYYSITREGRRALAAMSEYFTQLNEGLAQLRKKGG